MNDNPDYITVEKTVRGGLVCVLVMRWSQPLDSYVAVQCSRAMTPTSAQILAQTWAHDKGLEVR